MVEQRLKVRIIFYFTKDFFSLRMNHDRAHLVPKPQSSALVNWFMEKKSATISREALAASSAPHFIDNWFAVTMIFV